MGTESCDNNCWVVICSGSSTIEYHNQIKQFIVKYNPTTIGVNRVHPEFIPHYHLWVNRKRYKHHCKCVKKRSRLILGYKFKQDSYDKISYENDYMNKCGWITIKNGTIKGAALTGGTLAGAYAIWHGAKKLFYVGIDGIADRKHCYKEKIIENQSKLELLQAGTFGVLRDLNGMAPIKILTPTVYKEYYENIANFL